MFETRQNAAGQQAAASRAAKHGDQVRIVAIGAVADNPVRTRRRHVEHRQAVNIDAERV